MIPAHRHRRVSLPAILTRKRNVSGGRNRNVSGNKSGRKYSIFNHSHSTESQRAQISIIGQVAEISIKDHMEQVYQQI